VLQMASRRCTHAAPVLVVDVGWLATLAPCSCQAAHQSGMGHFAYALESVNQRVPFGKKDMDFRALTSWKARKKTLRGAWVANSRSSHLLH